jgi:transposase
MTGTRRTDGEPVGPLAVGGGPERSGGPPPTARPPDPEVPEKATRRRFSAEYKRGVLEEADACTEPGEIGALLRRVGLYSSHLSKWRKQRERGTLAGLRPKKRGPKPKRSDPMIGENERLRRENDRLRKQLRQAEAIIEIQKRASEILGISLESPESDGDE